jgi:hypothetical protein
MTPGEVLEKLAVYQEERDVNGILKEIKKRSPCYLSNNPFFRPVRPTQKGG